MKNEEKLNNYKKEFVYEQYIRIVEDFKDYEKITKTKMFDAIFDVYSDYRNIIDICTTKELKYLKMVLDTDITLNDVKLSKGKLKIEYLDSKYDWEREMLRKKFLIDYDYYNESYIFEQIKDSVSKAVKNTNFKEHKKIDELNEILVSYCKIQGSALLNTVALFGSGITGIKEEVIFQHMCNNKLFNYFVFIELQDLDGLGNNIPIAIYQDYYGISDELKCQRQKQGLAGAAKVDLRVYKTLFYNDFDINNKKIKRFLDELKKLPFFWFSAIQGIKEFAMLNIDRDPLKESIKNVPALANIDLTNFFKIMDEAMDEMPSGALNGFSPNEAKEILLEKAKIEHEKEEKYIKQSNACLSRKDAKLFYKIYFALLEFTNNIYHIKPGLKIYNKNGVNPYEISDIIDKFWENKDKIVLEFCLANPYKFNSEELKISSEFKKGFRNMVIIAKYEEEYTALMDKEKVYMVKGINDNIDNIISYKNLPYVCITSIIPFKDNLIYDGIILEMGIRMENNFTKIINEEYNSAIKYYHL